MHKFCNANNSNTASQAVCNVYSLLPVCHENGLTSSCVIRKVFSAWKSISRICACQAFCFAYGIV